MTKLADLMESNKELLATIDAWDNGENARLGCSQRTLMLNICRKTIFSSSGR